MGITNGNGKGMVLKKTFPLISNTEWTKISRIKDLLVNIVLNTSWLGPTVTLRQQFDDETLTETCGLLILQCENTN